MNFWECMVCGYVYNPQKGDPDKGVAAGTQFETIPAAWGCPICAADKTAFQPVF